jgi:polysaccharide pyruvyl transferase WcaK-like protein
MKIALLQCYSASNPGDGLLVDEAIELLQEAFGTSVEMTIVASYPNTFAHHNARLIRARPTRFGYSLDYIRFLAQIRAFDMVIGVGGGYLRFGSIKETLKTALVHMPQLIAAAWFGRRSLYLPQSVGPAPSWLRQPLASAFSKVDLFLVRDDRSVAEFPHANFSRYPDLALLSPHKRQRDPDRVDPVPVYSIRFVHGRVPGTLVALAQSLGEYVGYVHSHGAGNDDTAAMASLGGRTLITHDALFAPKLAQRRVVVAVRLHAALAAINAGHYAVHLAYERKGYGAFSDLGLSNYVHNVSAFDPDAVAIQVRELLTNKRTREAYDSVLERANRRFSQQRSDLVERIRALNDGVLGGNVPHVSAHMA